MKSKLLIPIFVMILLVMNASAFVISGTVTDTALTPINGAQIDVSNAITGLPINSATTNSTGDYSVDVGAIPTLMVVNASEGSYTPQSTPIFVDDNKTINFALGPIQSVILSGYVRDNASSPLNNADVVVKQGGATFTQTNTNAAGYYSVNVIDADSYDVTASLTGYDSSTESITISGNTAQDFTLTLIPPACTDNDGDNYGDGCALGPDCDDSDGNIHPGATEVCGDGIDNDCSGGDAACPPPPSSSCFPAGTKILMEDGEKNIEDVKVGDNVIGFDGDVKVSVEVLELESPVRDHMYTLTFEDGSTLELTREHPLYTKEGWKSLSPEETVLENSALKVKVLDFGDKVLNSEGDYVEIVSIDYAEKEVQTYNLKSVSEYNNFYADGYLAHNKGGSSSYSPESYDIVIIEESATTKELRREDEVNFEYENEYHKMTVDAVYSNGAKVTVESDPITEIIYLYQTKGFNLDGDLANDLFVTLKSISNRVAKFDFQLAEKMDVPYVPIVPSTPAVDDEDEIVDVPGPQISGSPITIVVEDEAIVIVEDDEEDGDKATSVFISVKNFVSNAFEKVLYLKYIVAGVLILVVLIVVISITTKIKTAPKKRVSKKERQEELREKVFLLEKQIRTIKKGL
jgi:hypothetical protein